MKSATDRRSALLANFVHENVTFEFIDAVEAAADLPVEEVAQFVSRQLERAAFAGKRAPVIRAETAAAISHLRLFVRAEQEQPDAVAQFEDDVALLPNYKARVLQLFNQLPNDWDFVYLSECLHTDDWSPVGKPVGEDVLTLRRGPCTTGFAYRLTGVTKVLHHVRAGTGLQSPFDVLLGNLAFAKKINMYTSPRRLAKPSRAASTIQHSTSHNQTVELPWDSSRRGLIGV